MAYSALHDSKHVVLGLDTGIYPDIERYPIGSVWWYSNPYTKKSDYTHPHRNHDFTTSRPVIIMSRNISFSNQLVVIQRNGTMTRPGFDSYLQDSAVDDKLVGARICPYDIKSVGKEYLTEMIGFLKPELFAVVQKAFAWHVGLSDEVPPYMLDSYNRARFCNEITYGGMREHLARRYHDRSAAKADADAAITDADDVGETIDDILRCVETESGNTINDQNDAKEEVELASNSGTIHRRIFGALSTDAKQQIAQMKNPEIVEKYGVSSATAYRWRKLCREQFPNAGDAPTEAPADRIATAFKNQKNEELLIANLLNGEKATPFQISQLIRRINQSKKLLSIMSDSDAKIFIQIPITSAPKLHLTKELMSQLQNEYLEKLLAARG